MDGLTPPSPLAQIRNSQFLIGPFTLYYMYCSFGLPEGGIFEIELYGLQSWYTASLCHHNGAAKRNFDESPLWSS